MQIARGYGNHLPLRNLQLRECTQIGVFIMLAEVMVKVGSFQNRRPCYSPVQAKHLGIVCNTENPIKVSNFYHVPEQNKVQINLTSISSVPTSQTRHSPVPELLD